MKILEGYTEITPTEEIKARIKDKRLLEGDNLLVQEMRFGENGCIRIIGNRNPDPERHQQLMDEVGAILYEGYLKRLRTEAEQSDKEAGA